MSKNDNNVNKEGLNIQKRKLTFFEGQIERDRIGLQELHFEVSVDN